ncbi:MAG: Ldh family oxidoreductase [Kiloniellales bacterium]|nr:Ldh family oxidoreductase [Kiloniellales bacterium]
MSKVLSLPEVYELAFDALVASGASPENAAGVAVSVREAEADGLHEIGLGFLPAYCRDLFSGLVDGQARPERRENTPAAIYVDARHGFAHPAFIAGEEALCAAARKNGIAALGIGNSYSSGVLGFFADRIARAGLIGLAATNSFALMAPWGGSKAVFGTNPIAAAFPRKDGPPVVIDLSSSTTAWVNVKAAADRGDKIPPDWAFDESGHPTTDAKDALKGTMAPLGGPKGCALALLVEVLAAGLTGACWSYEAGVRIENGMPQGIGQFFLAIDPMVFGAGSFEQRLETLLTTILAQEGVRLPGDRRRAARAEAEAKGIEVDKALYEELLGYTAGKPTDPQCGPR